MWIRNADGEGMLAKQERYMRSQFSQGPIPSCETLKEKARSREREKERGGEGEKGVTVRQLEGITVTAICISRILSREENIKPSSQQGHFEDNFFLHNLFCISCSRTRYRLKSCFAISTHS